MLVECFIEQAVVTRRSDGSFTATVLLDVFVKSVVWEANLPWQVALRFDGCNP